MIKSLTVVVPAYNEGKTISVILKKLITQRSVFDIEKEIIVVNDCSKDNTNEAVERFIDKNPGASIRLISHDVNQGKGAAIRTGIQHATGDCVIIQDADLEYDPAEYDRLLKPIVDGMADVVYGSRFLGGSAHRVLFFWHSIGNKLLTTISNAFTNMNLTDMETCYKMFRREVIQSIPLRENRFGFEPEVTAKVARIPNIRIYEVGISYYGRTYAEGKKINWKDGFRAIYCVLKYNLFRKRGKKISITLPAYVNHGEPETIHD
jgi:glycosyltransferase involved in cell wall biosynthesis